MLKGEQDSGGVGGREVHLSPWIHQESDTEVYAPSDTEVYAEHQLREDRSN